MLEYRFQLLVFTQVATKRKRFSNRMYDLSLQLPDLCHLFPRPLVLVPGDQSDVESEFASNEAAQVYSAAARDELERSLLLSYHQPRKDQP